MRSFLKQTLHFRTVHRKVQKHPIYSLPPHMHVCSVTPCPNSFSTLWTITYQASLSMGFLASCIINVFHQGDTFLRLMNLYWHITTTRSPKFILGLTLGIVHSMGVEKYIMMCIHYCIIHSIFTALKIHLLFTPSSSLNHDNHWSFHCFHMPFSECHVVGIIQYVALVSVFLL